MGIMSRRVGERFVITSDRDAEGVEAKTVKKRLNDTYQVWTGSKWSAVVDDAQSFSSMDDADEYVRANFARIMAPKP
jgi:hypothetical protein